MAPMARTDEPSGLNVRKFLEVPLRRPWHVLIPFMLVALGSVAASKAVNKRYRSSTLSLLEKQKVPADYVKATVTSG